MKVDYPFKYYLLFNWWFLLYFAEASYSLKLLEWKRQIKELKKQKIASAKI